jgi:hypothetical protein
VDHWSYGADRSALLFATLRLHPGRGLVARDSTGRIKGYLIRSARGRVIRIGPFLASTPDVAHLLLTRALSVTGGIRPSRSLSQVLPSARLTPSCKNSASRAQRTGCVWSWARRRLPAVPASSTTALRPI